MKPTKRLTWLALAGLMGGLAAPALAQEGQPRGRGGLLAALDLNGNGKLEPNEIDMAVVSLRKLDRNKDGAVAAEELWGGARPDRPPGSPGQRGPQPGRMPDFSQFDKDGDGKISKEEAPERMLERFDQMDANGDGFFDKAEQDELIKRLRERFQQRGGQRPTDRRPDAGAGEGATDKPKRPEPKGKDE